MKKVINVVLLLGLVMLPLMAQTNYVRTTGGTLTARAGDGTSCSINKIQGSVPSVTVTCTPGLGSMSYGPAPLSVATGKSGASTFQVGDILCLIGMNATQATISMGSLGSVPVNGAVFSCSVNIRSAGPTTTITSTVAVPNQTIIWP